MRRSVSCRVCCARVFYSRRFFVSFITNKKRYTPFTREKRRVRAAGRAQKKNQKRRVLIRLEESSKEEKPSSGVFNNKPCNKHIACCTSATIRCYRYNITDEWEMFYLVGTIVLFLFQLVKHLDYLPVHIFQVQIFIQ